MSSRKKVLHILYSGLGGHGNVFFSMVDADKEKEYDYAALFMGIEPVKEEYKLKCAEKNISYSGVLKKPGFDIPFFFKMYREIKKARPDIVFMHGPLNILPSWFYRLSRLFNAKLVVRETEPNHLKTKSDWFWLHVAMRISGKILFLSEQFRDDVKKRMGFLFSNRRTGVIPNGIDLDLFKPAPVGYQWKPGVYILGMQSRLERSKDHISLIQAFALLKDKPYFSSLLLRIAGDGTKRAELEELARTNGLADKVEFCGMLKEPELVLFLQSLDMYIHASTGETMSTAIMQSMACKLPVIASDVKGINNMVLDGKNGLLAPVKDPAALATTIDRFYHDRELQEKLAAQAYAYAVDKFSNRRMFLSYQAIFENKS